MVNIFTMSYRRVYNLERDIKATDWLVYRVRHDEVFAQNLYAAFCNHEFVPKDVWGILTNIRWSCQWHYAAGLIGEIREESANRWYCSGIQLINSQFVPESFVVPEIEETINVIGWIVQDLK